MALAGTSARRGHSRRASPKASATVWARQVGHILPVPKAVLAASYTHLPNVFQSSTIRIVANGKHTGDKAAGQLLLAPDTRPFAGGVTRDAVASRAARGKAARG